MTNVPDYLHNDCNEGMESVGQANTHCEARGRSCRICNENTMLKFSFVIVKASIERVEQC